ncbi:MFS transporter [Photobacterium alginatilyticum]|uniref:MFS transporter n=1 Tax=Photobacterium alginatilyticum TaxID=1775171 RepID=UPI0040690177
MKSSFPMKLTPLLVPIRLDSLGVFFINFLIPIIAHQNFEANGWQMGILFSLQAVGTGCSALLFSKRVNYWNTRANLIRLGCIIKMLAYILLYAAILSSSYTLMVVATFTLGFGAGLFWLVWKTCFAQLSAYNNRAEALGVASKHAGIGIMWGSSFAFCWIAVAEYFSLPPFITYISLIVFAIASAIAGMMSFKAISVLANQEVTPDTMQSDKIIFSTITIFLFSMIFVGQLSGSLVAPFLEVYLLEHLKITSIVDLSMAYIPGGIVSMLLAPKLGYYADKMNAAIYLTIAGLTGAFTTWLMLQSTSLWHISVLFTVDASIIMSSSLVLAKLISEVAGNSKGSAFGLQGFISNFGAISGPLVGGLFWQMQGSKGPFMFSISTEVILALCCFTILLPALNKSRRFAKEPKPET